VRLTQNILFSGPTNTLLHTAPCPTHYLALHSLLGVISNVSTYQQGLLTLPGVSTVAACAATISLLTAIQAHSLLARTELPTSMLIPVVPSAKQTLALPHHADGSGCQATPFPLPVGQHTVPPSCTQGL